ncbi:RNA-binding cell elongation regulator Jag/EloR, partial [Chloroflexota bacterium]
ARTVEEAIQLALEQLGVSREKVEVTVLKEGRHGILGLGADEAVIRVHPLASKPKKGNAMAEAAKDILEELLAAMGVTASVELQSVPSGRGKKKDETPIAFNITGEDLGILIGRQGQTLSCLQYIVRIILAHKTDTWVPMVIDVEGYRERRDAALQDLALRMVEQVKVRGVPFTLRPMSAYERRIIHLTLAEHPDVTTESTGEGEARRVVISPR